MLEYVEQITRDATRISPAFHDRLRAVGFDDRGILQITLIASWFNYINRVADALGVGRGDWPRSPEDPDGRSSASRRFDRTALGGAR